MKLKWMSVVLGVLGAGADFVFNYPTVTGNMNQIICQ
jgi:hypothetical protein